MTRMYFISLLIGITFLGGCGLNSNEVVFKSNKLVAMTSKYGTEVKEKTDTIEMPLKIILNQKTKEIKFESANPDHYFYTITDMEFDANSTQAHQAAYIGTPDEDSLRCYVYTGECADWPSAKTYLVFYITQRPSNKEIINLVILRELRYTNGMSYSFVYHIDAKSFKKLDWELL